MATFVNYTCKSLIKSIPGFRRLCPRIVKTLHSIDSAANVVQQLFNAPFCNLLESLSFFKRAGLLH